MKGRKTLIDHEKIVLIDLGAFIEVIAYSMHGITGYACE